MKRIERKGANRACGHFSVPARQPALTLRPFHPAQFPCLLLGSLSRAFAFFAVEFLSSIRVIRAIRGQILVFFVISVSSVVAGERQVAPADLEFDYAEGLYRDGLRKLAIPELGKFVKAHPEDSRAPLAQFYLGESLYVDKDYKAAAPAYEAAVRDAKLIHRPAALYRLGDSRFRLGDTAGAVDPLRQFLAAKLDTQETKGFVLHAKYVLARSLFAQRQFADALPLFQDVLVDPAPDNAYKAYVLLPIGDALLALGKADDALGRYRDLEKYLVASLKDAKDPAKKSQMEMLQSIRSKIANILLGKKKYEEGLAALQALDDKGPFAEEILYGRAQALFSLQRTEDALAPALECLKRFPDGKLATSALYIAGECHYRANRFPEAERYFGQFLDRDREGEAPAEPKKGKHPARETAAFGRAAAAYRQDRPHAKETAAAAEFFLQQFPKNPRVADIRFFRAEAAFWLAEYPVALERYKEIPADSPYAEDATHQTAVCLDLLKRRDEAAAAYDAYVAKYPTGKYARNAAERSARLWGELTQFAKAADRYGAFLDKYGADEEGKKVAEEFFFRKGAAEFETKKFDTMYQTYRIYVERYPKGAHLGDVQYFLAWYLAAQKKQYEAAAVLYDLAANLPGNFALRARYNLAHTYRMIAEAQVAAKNRKEADQSYGKAAECFLQLMRTAPKELAGEPEYRWTAEVLRDLDRKPEAIEAYEALIKTYPAAAKAEDVYWIGELALKSKPPDYKKAETYFRLFLKDFPTHGYVIWGMLNLAETLKDAKKGTKEHAEAWDLYQKVEQLAAHKLEDPQTRDGLILRCKFQIGLMAFDDQNYEYARDYLLRPGYLAAGNEAAEALYKAGHATFRLKEVDAALAMWNRLLRQHPKSPWAEQLLKELPGLGLKLGEDGKSIEKVLK